MPLAQPSITNVATTGKQPFLGKIPYAKGHDGVGFPVILDGGRKIAKTLTGEMTFGEGFCQCCQPQIHWYDIHKCR